MELQITASRACEISSLAIELLTEFWDGSSPSWLKSAVSESYLHENIRMRKNETSRDLLARGRDVPAVLKTFADWVVLRTHAADWGTGDYPPLEMAVSLPLFKVLDVRRVGRLGLNGYGSWLYRSEKHGVYDVAMDYLGLAESCHTAGKNLGELRVKLFLHELGHLVLHKNKLLTGVKANSPAIDADAEMEVEAWYFAAVMIGLIAGDVAHFSKTSGTADRSWLNW